MGDVLVAGTRRSKLALAQTRQIAAQLQQHHPGLIVKLRPIVTEGDRTEGPLWQAGRGAFTGSIESALLEGRIDFAVHSLKDLPVETPDELVLAAVLSRVSASDALVTRDGIALEDLAPESRVGTSSQRRRAQLLAWRSDVEIVPVRGNVDTRVRLLERREVDALVLAEAGLLRLAINGVSHTRIPPEIMVPAPGQGALAVECRRSNEETRRLLERLDCAQARDATSAERTFLHALGGGCSLPVGAWAQWKNGELSMTAVVSARNGSRSIRVQGRGHRARELGKSLAEQACHQGALELLTDE
ncbi:MAG: hydroxymethylbilane synthase [Bacteroidota bacterium]|nr:hydroxymethylbilane synthase [Bacteroidota bacterium]